MHKVTELSHDFLLYWKSAWPNYSLMPEKDSKPILELAEACAKRIGVELDEEPGYKRVAEAIKRIATWCSNDKKWRKETMFTINQAIQTIMQEMIAGKKSEEEALYEQRAAQRAFEHSQTERGKIEKEMAKATEASKEWHEKNWTAEDQNNYEKYLRRITPGRVISIEIDQDKSINKAL